MDTKQKIEEIRQTLTDLRDTIPCSCSTGGSDQCQQFDLILDDLELLKDQIKQHNEIEKPRWVSFTIQANGKTSEELRNIERQLEHAVDIIQATGISIETLSNNSKVITDSGEL